MPSDREKLEIETLEQLGDRMQDGPSSGRHYHAPFAELERRKALWARQATEAQREAADAAKATACYTRRAARYMLWSVIAVIAASFLSVLLPTLLHLR